MSREVAMKLSAERFSDRFEREVHAAAALDHANICQVYDVPELPGDGVGRRADAAERIQQGAVPLEESLAFVRQIVDALERRHYLSGDKALMVNVR